MRLLTLVLPLCCLPFVLSTAHHIPHILHTIYLSGREELLSNSGYPPAWTESCLNHHVHWAHYFWDRAAAESFIEAHYAWFVPVWKNYASLVQQADALRALVLNHFGGVYLDSDIQCLRNLESFLGNNSLVLQGESGKPSVGAGQRVTNSVGASVRGHPYWEHVMEVLVERADSKDAIFSTGPTAWSDALFSYVHFSSSKMQLALKHSTKVYPINTFFYPCFFDDKQCDVNMKRNLAMGTLDPNLAGIHRFLGLWDARGGKHSDTIPLEVCSEQ